MQGKVMGLRLSISYMDNQKMRKFQSAYDTILYCPLQGLSPGPRLCREGFLFLPCNN